MYIHGSYDKAQINYKHVSVCILSEATVLPVLHCHWLQQFTADFLCHSLHASILSAQSSTSHCPFYSLSFSHLPSSFLPFPSLGMFDGLMLLSLPSSKERDDCIYQAVVYLRDASGTVVLHSHSEQSLVRKKKGARLVCIWRTNW